jgi:uncharacterized protein YuzE
MRLEGQYDPRADIAWLRVEEPDDDARVDEDAARDALRSFDSPSGRTVGVAVRHARRNLPSEFLKMLRQVPGAAPQSTPRARRHSSGLAHHRRLKQLHDAWG